MIPTEEEQVKGVIRAVVAASALHALMRTPTFDAQLRETETDEAMKALQHNTVLDAFGFADAFLEIGQQTTTRPA